MGLANWTPEGFIGQLFRTVGGHAPYISPCAWGTAARFTELFGAYGNLWVTHKHVAFRSRTPLDWVSKLRASYLPVRKAFAVLNADGKRALRSALLELVGKFNRVTDGTMVVDAEYLEVLVTRR